MCVCVCISVCMQNPASAAVVSRGNRVVAALYKQPSQTVRAAAAMLDVSARAAPLAQHSVKPAQSFRRARVRKV